MSRPGHSLAELLVALTVLAATAGAVAGASAAAARTATVLVRRQEALSLAAATLDSLVAAPDPRGGAGVADRFHVRWTVEAIAAARRLSVHVVDPAAEAQARLETVWAPPPPAYPEPEP